MKCPENMMREELVAAIIEMSALLLACADALQEQEENGYNNPLAMKIYKYLGLRQ